MGDTSDAPTENGNRHERSAAQRAQSGRSTEAPFLDVRHASATYLVVAGVPMRVVMETLGHSRISLMMNRYSHVSLAVAREAADARDLVMNTGARIPGMVKKMVGN